MSAGLFLSQGEGRLTTPHKLLERPEHSHAEQACQASSAPRGERKARDQCVAPSFPISYPHSAAARVAAIHGDPAMAAAAALLGLLAAWAWYCLVEGRDVELRRVRRVEAMYRRRYAGRRLAWLRAEYGINYAALVLIWRVLPRPFQTAVVATFVWMLVGPWGFVVLSVRGRAGASDLSAILDSVDASELLDNLEAYRWAGGPKGYPLRALWRAYLSSFLLGLPSTNALIRRLQDDPEFRLLCGFSTLPHRTTFNRFIQRLDRHTDLVEDCLAAVTDQLAELLPGLGEKVALDSTTVRSHSNPNRVGKTGEVSDPEASWTAKNSARSKGQKEWHWGYKYHLVTEPPTGYRSTATPRPPARTTPRSCPVCSSWRPRPTGG